MASVAAAERRPERTDSDQLVEAIPTGLTRHPRTVRRDLAALEASHFPLLTERVDGEVRWRLLDGFKNIPALRLSPTELMALAPSAAA